MVYLKFSASCEQLLTTTNKIFNLWLIWHLDKSMKFSNWKCRTFANSSASSASSLTFQSSSSQILRQTVVFSPSCVFFFLNIFNKWRVYVCTVPHLWTFELTNPFALKLRFHVTLISSITCVWGWSDLFKSCFFFLFVCFYFKVVNSRKVKFNSISMTYTT